MWITTNKAFQSSFKEQLDMGKGVSVSRGTKIRKMSKSGTFKEKKYWNRVQLR